jgi:hypothetical protein
VIFLVGAAWMPLAFHLADRWLRLAQRKALPWLAVVLAMQTLGGDPEAAYLATFSAGAYAVGLSLASGGGQKKRRGALAGLALLFGYIVLLIWKAGGEDLGRRMHLGWWPSAERLALLVWGAAVFWLVARVIRRRRWDSWQKPLVGLAGASLLALALTAVQLVPCLEFIAQSPRGGSTTPAQIYDFSIHPARVLETLWPNVFGTITRGNERWLEALPPTYDYQVWIESVYQGGLILLLGLAAAGVRRGPAWRVWLTGVAIVGWTASLGSYGSPLFWLRSLSVSGPIPDPLDVPAVTGSASASIPGGVGSIYWLLATALPGFSAFRYPGKLVVVASLALCGLAGIGWDELVRGTESRASRLAAAGLACTFCLVLLFGLPLGRTEFLGFLRRHPDLTTTVFGPLDAAGAYRAVWHGLIHAGATLALGLALFRFGRRSPSLAGALALLLLGIELSLANAPLVHAVPQEIFETRPTALDQIDRAEAQSPSGGPFRIHRMPNWAPGTWLTRGSNDRLEEITRWDRDSLRPKYGITEGVAYTSTKGTAELTDLLPFFDFLRIQLDPATNRRHGFAAGSRVLYYMRRGFDLWNTRYFILPARLVLDSRFRGFLSFLPKTTEIAPPPGDFDGAGGDRRRQSWLMDEDVQILRNDAAFPRAWIVHRARFHPKTASQNPTDLRRVMDEILYQDDELWQVDGRRVYDPRVTAWLELTDDERKSIGPALSGADPDASETVKVVSYGSDRVELTAGLKSPGLLVLADVYYPGWELTIDGEPAPILRTNRAMRGALLSQGIHRLIYTYRPASVKVGAVISIMGVLTFLAWLWQNRAKLQPKAAGE